MEDTENGESMMDMESVVRKLSAVCPSEGGPSASASAPADRSPSAHATRHFGDLEEDLEDDEDNLERTGTDPMLKERSQQHYRGMGHLLKMKVDDIDEEEEEAEAGQEG